MNCPGHRMKLIKKILHPLLVPLAKNYLRKDRRYNYQGMSLWVAKGVFHPGLFFSTGLLLRFLKKQNLQGMTFLDLGAGSGLIALMASRWGAKATASDISQTAILCIEKNARLNQSPLNILHSDLFDAFEPVLFDWVVINPPFYPKDPQNEAEYAWYGGKNLEYFEKLFRQLPGFIHSESWVLMVLSEDCPIRKIGHLAQKNQLCWEQIEIRLTGWERNYLFKISKV